MSTSLKMNTPDLATLLLDSFLMPPNYSSRRRQPENIDIPLSTYDDEKTVIIYAEMAGVERESIKIQPRQTKLLIRARRKPLFSSEQDRRNAVDEIKVGDLEKEISIPICITKKESVTTEYVDGVLKITIDKTKEADQNFSITV